MAEQREGAPPGLVALGDIQAFAERPLPELRSGRNLAYEAAAAQSERPAFVLVCDPSSLPRLDVIAAARKIETSGALMPLSWRIASWPPTGRRHVIIAFDKPAGGRLPSPLDQATKPLGEDEAVRGFLASVAPALRQMHASGIVHGAVNPGNLLYGDSARRRIMLGECVSLGVGTAQPAFCMPIEAAMAAPAARGLGKTTEDIFALGVTLAALVLGRNPVAAIEPAALMRARLDLGSYPAIIGGNRIPIGLIELLRGLLTDDPKIRWTSQEIEEWLVSHHTVTRQGVAPKRASRPFDFGGRAHVTARSLAQALAEDPTAAAAAIRTNEFDSWTQRALGDEASTNLLKLARQEGGEQRPDAREAGLVSRVCIALDPEAPLRYRDLAAAIDGLGGALAEAVTQQRPFQTVAEALAIGLPHFFLRTRNPPPPEHVQLLKLYDRLRMQLEDKRFGFGIERVLYELNPTLHCLSPLVERDCVVAIGGLLPALERQAADNFGGGFPIDRHIAAFVATKLKSANEWTDGLTGSDPLSRIIGALRLLSRLQALNGTTIANLARWLARQAMPLVEGYHHRPTRKRIAKELEAAGQNGNLRDMLMLVDDPELAQRDAAGFAEAVRAHAVVTGGLTRLAAEASQHGEQIQQLGGQLAAGLATIAAGAALLASLALLG